MKRAILLVLATAACTPVDTGFGGAVRTDYALQVIDPDAGGSARAATTSGEQAGGAAERYRKGAVKQPVTIQTTQALSGAASGQGSH